MSVPASQPRINESLTLQVRDIAADRPPELTNVREVESAKIGSELPTPHQKAETGTIEEEDKKQVIDLGGEEELEGKPSASSNMFQLADKGNVTGD